MPITRPTLQVINARVQGDIEAAVSPSSPLLPRSVLRVLAKVIAGSIHLVYGFAVWMAKQVFPDTADADSLERWAAIWGVQRNNATYASCDITVTGEDGSTIVAGTRWISSDRVEYESSVDAVIAASTATISVDAMTSGALGNVLVGQTLTLTSPVTGVDGSATVAASVVDGYDAETDASLLSRLEARIQNPPHGGNAADYVMWAKETPTVRVTRAWAYANHGGPGYVGLTFVMDDETDPIPDEPARAAVAAYVETKRPLTANLTVFVPVEKVINFTIAVTPNTAEVKQAVTDALTAHISESGYPGQTVYLSKLNESISSAVGEEDHVMTIPAANVVVASNEFATLGTITWA